jgi:hypothetical protein
MPGSGQPGRIPHQENQKIRKGRDDLSQANVTPSRLRRLSPLLLLLAVCMLSQHAAAWNQSEIKWKTLETEHFEIHFHPGEEWSARQAAAIAEAVYEPITAFYDYHPGTVHINLYDKEDDPEGATYYYMDRIDISASPYDFHLRGTADWLRNVITHEFTHMVSVQKAMKMPVRIPSIFFQVISFEKEKRPDVLTGYPNFQLSLPFAGEVMPNWFAEGVAQYQCRLARNDIWDSHRDMLLRMATLEDRLLTIDEMGVFAKNSLEAEMVYNQGFSLVRFIAVRHGFEKLADLTEALSSVYRFGFDGACKEVLGISEGELYRSWKKALEEHYGAFETTIGGNERRGEPIALKGFLNLYPVDDGHGGIYFISNRGEDYSNLELVHMTDKGIVRGIAPEVESRFELAPKERELCYSRRTDKNRHGYAIDDIFVRDLDTGEERRLTRGLRATDPCWSPDGGSLACAVRRDGSERIAVIDLANGELTYITPLREGRQIFGLSWSSRGILASAFDDTSRDILLVDPVTGDETVLLGSLADERDALWSKDGKGFFYASDRTGIFNIYHHDLETGSEIMITNVLGGAFFPSERGLNLLYAGYGAEGYGIREIAGWREAGRAVDSVSADSELMSQRTACISASAGITERTPAVLDMDETGSIAGVGETATGSETGLDKAPKFGIQYTKLFLFPSILVYEGEPRIGLFVDSRDLLDRQSVTAGGTINSDKEFDLQLSFETRQFKPTFSFDIFRSRKYYTYFTRSYGSDYELYYRYDLWDAFFTCTFELEPRSASGWNEISIRYNHGEYGLNFEVWELVPDREFRYAIGWNYYKANEFSLLFDYRSVHREVDADINPRRGRTLALEVTRAYDELDSGEFEFAFKPVFDRNEFGRYMLSYEEYVPLPFWHHALTLFVKGGAIDNRSVDDFFNLYLGGRDGLKGYSYYSMGGRKLAMGRILYRFPIWKGINRQLMHLYFGSLYGGVFAEAGKAWNEDEIDLNGNKKDYGFELRLKGFTFYNMPLAASFEAAYGLDDVVYTDPFNQEITFYEGKNWKYYGTVLFGF